MAQKHTFQLTTFIECVDHRGDEISATYYQKVGRILTESIKACGKEDYNFVQIFIVSRCTYAALVSSFLYNNVKGKKY